MNLPYARLPTLLTIAFHHHHRHHNELRNDTIVFQEDCRAAARSIRTFRMLP